MSTTLTRPTKKVTFFSHLAGRIDSDEGVIHGVSVITTGKAKGHDLIVDETTLEQIKEQAELKEHGLKAKLNHRTGVEAIFGSLKNFRVEGPKLLADLHMLREHKDYAQTMEQMRTLPTELGLSVAFVGKEERSSKGEKLARCKEIISTDLVPEPAANPTGLFEKVDTERIDMDTEAVLEGIQETLKGIDERLGGVEQFQQAVQTEIESAAQEDQIFYDADGNLVDAEGNPLSDEEGNPLTVDDLAETQRLIEEGVIDADGNVLDPEALANDGQNAGHAAVDGINPPAGNAGAGGTEGGNAMNGQGSQYAGATAGGGNEQGQYDPAAEYPNESPEVQAALGRLDGFINRMENAEAEQAAAAERHEFDQNIGVLREKIKVLADTNEKVQLQNEALRDAVRNGHDPVAAGREGRIFLSDPNSDKGEFEIRIAELTKEGKSRAEAVTLARKENPASHTEYLSRIGVLHKMEA